MTTWPDLEFVQLCEDNTPPLRGEERTGWEDIVFEIGDDEALD